MLRADGSAAGRQPSRAVLQRLRDVVRSPRALTLVAEQAGTVTGFLVAELGRDEPGVLLLSHLCVRPQDRRRGTGRALVDALLARFPQVVCRVPEGPARSLLEVAGLQPTGRTDGEQQELRSTESPGPPP